MPKIALHKKVPILSRTSRYVSLVAAAAAIVYALFAGLRTVSDPDLGWQLATGRWIVQHRAIPSTDVLSYTALGREWIYPVLSQVILYFTYLLGGYSLLSWLSAAACVGTVAILLRGRSLSNVLAVLAVPLIAARTAPRAELFTEVLFALFVSVLWHYQKSGRERLWLLPPLMFLWVNLHQGFVAGLGMCAAYVFLEIGDSLIAERRTASLGRLRAALPWLIATLGATLVNPWGPWNYAGMVKLLPVHSSKTVAELMSVPVTLSSISEAFAWRDTKSALWWLIAAVLLAMLVAAYQRRVAPFLILGASIYLVFHSVRFVAPFATVAVVIGGSILADACDTGWRHRMAEPSPHERTLRQLSATLVVVLLVALAGIRVMDLVTNRYYMRTSESSDFGPGISSWYPEESAAFILREHLPGNIFHDYNFGGFLAWRLSPEYPDYIDGRGGPFGDELFFHSTELMRTSLDSPEWKSEADARNINTVVVSLTVPAAACPTASTVSAEVRTGAPFTLIPVQLYSFVAVRRLPIFSSD